MNEISDTKPPKRDDLWWDVILVVIFHGILCALLLLILWFIIPLIGSLLGDFMGSLPWYTQQLLNASNFVRRLLLSLVAVLVLLWVDGKIYRWLCVTRGKKAGTLYAAAVGGIILIAILWFGILFGRSVYMIGEWHQSWRLKVRAEQNAAQLPRAPQTGHAEGAH